MYVCENMKKIYWHNMHMVWRVRKYITHRMWIQTKSLLTTLIVILLEKTVT